MIKEDRLPTECQHKIDDKEYSGNLGISEQRRYYDNDQVSLAKKRLEIVTLYWARAQRLLTFKENNTKMQEMIFQENYFLSSRNALVSISNVSFGVRYVTKGLPAAIILYNSQNTNASVSKFKLRPIIEILSPSRLKQVNGKWTI